MKTTHTNTPNAQGPRGPMTAEERLDRMIEFYNTLSLEDVDLAYFADADHRSTDDLRDAIEDGQGFDVEIIYYSNAIKYLTENDPSLRESCELAADMGYEVKNLNSEVLASILASQNAREDFEELADEIDEFLEELNEEEEERENEDEDEDEDETEEGGNDDL